MADAMHMALVGGGTWHQTTVLSASEPVAKLLVGSMSPLLLAGLLYLRSRLGLGMLLLVGAGLRHNVPGDERRCAS